MDRPESLSHSLWECKYHVVFIPKYRRRGRYAQLRRHLGEVFHQLARQPWHARLKRPTKGQFNVRFRYFYIAAGSSHGIGIKRRVMLEKNFQLVVGKLQTEAAAARDGLCIGLGRRFQENRGRSQPRR